MSNIIQLSDLPPDNTINSPKQKFSVMGEEFENSDGALVALEEFIKNGRLHSDGDYSFVEVKKFIGGYSETAWIVSIRDKHTNEVKDVVLKLPHWNESKEEVLPKGLALIADRIKEISGKDLMPRIYTGFYCGNIPVLVRDFVDGNVLLDLYSGKEFAEGIDDTSNIVWALLETAYYASLAIHSLTSDGFNLLANFCKEPDDAREWGLMLMSCDLDDFIFDGEKAILIDPSINYDHYTDVSDDLYRTYSNAIYGALANRGFFMNNTEIQRDIESIVSKYRPTITNSQRNALHSELVKFLETTMRVKDPILNNLLAQWLVSIKFGGFDGLHHSIKTQIEMRNRR